MDKTNYSVARVVTYTKQSIVKAERHNERKNTNYSNMNVDLEQTKNNIHYKTCDKSYNERLKELVNTGKVSLRGLKDNAKVFDELILDINSDYFEKHGGYDFAKRFYEEAFHFAEKEYGKDTLELPKLVNEEYKNKRFYLVDDIYATGNTMKAMKQAIEDVGGIVVGQGVIMNIKELNDAQDVYSLLDINET